VNGFQLNSKLPIQNYWFCKCIHFECGFPPSMNFGKSKLKTNLHSIEICNSWAAPFYTQLHILATSVKNLTEDNFSHHPLDRTVLERTVSQWNQTKQHRASENMTIFPDSGKECSVSLLCHILRLDRFPTALQQAPHRCKQPS